jgi:hypothetical protein
LPAQLGSQPKRQEHFSYAHRPDPGPGFIANLLAERSRKKTESLNEIPRVPAPFQHPPKIKGNRKKKSEREEEIVEEEEHRQSRLSLEWSDK